MAEIQKQTAERLEVALARERIGAAKLRYDGSI
jgi:hypothetical protein